MERLQSIQDTMRAITSHSNQAYLAGYRLPTLSFSNDKLKYKSLTGIFRMIRSGDELGAKRQILNQMGTRNRMHHEERSALLVALAGAEYSIGAIDSARRFAGRALDYFPNQWAANRVLLNIQSSKQQFKSAYLHLSELDPGPVPIWDEPLTKQMRHTTLASFSWLLGDWDDVAKHLKTAFPKGVSTMPPQIQEDWFRLSLYRGRPEDAVAVAAELIVERPVDSADEILQTLVQNGWFKEALPLYRSAYESSPNSQLLRRRLVALCIREGALEEARLLTKPGALDLAA
ncbi:MAG: tetratricopeptide repeat protein [Rhodothermales bacterium]|nr:tetratricopeptide repeat protein [Rhodothermales bacterium]